MSNFTLSQINAVHSAYLSSVGEDDKTAKAVADEEGKIMYNKTAADNGGDGGAGGCGDGGVCGCVGGGGCGGEKRHSDCKDTGVKNEDSALNKANENSQDSNKGENVNYVQLAPLCNVQLECHPFCQQISIVKFCQARDIVITAYRFVWCSL